MSIATEITRIQTDRNTMRTKLVDFGLVQSAATLDDIATAVDGIENRGAISATVQEGDTYTIPKGYHNGTGTVSGVAGGGNYNLQSKAVTPTKSQQAITPDAGYYGLSDVTVAAIPANYQDVSSTTATAADVLANKIFVGADGATIAGTMPNVGAVSKTLDATNTSYTVPKGSHDGKGVVKITPETKSVTPTKTAQTVAPTAGKVLTEVTVAAIPVAYQDVSGVTATADKVLEGSKIVDAGGNLLEGAIPVNGDVSKTIDGLTQTSAEIPAGYTTGGAVSLTNDIEQALAAI